jgi:hypothetical protein
LSVFNETTHIPISWESNEEMTSHASDVPNLYVLALD